MNPLLCHRPTMDLLNVPLWMGSALHPARRVELTDRQCPLADQGQQLAIDLLRRAQLAALVDDERLLVVAHDGGKRVLAIALQSTKRPEIHGVLLCWSE